MIAKWEAEADIVTYDDVYADVPVELEVEKPYTVEESSEEDAVTEEVEDSEE